MDPRVAILIGFVIAFIFWMALSKLFILILDRLERNHAAEDHR